jgi:hypothetical protein
LEAEETVAHLCVPTKEIADAEEPVEHWTHNIKYEYQIAATR